MSNGSHAAPGVYNPLDEYPQARRIAYAAQWVVNLVLGILAVVLTALGQSPQWFIILGAVFAFIWTYTGLTAQSNTAARSDGVHPEPGGEEYDYALEDEVAAGIPTIDEELE